MRPSAKIRGVSTTAVIAALSSVFISYEVARALGVSITIDEAVTFLIYIKSGLLSLFNFNEANNHFLNTLLAKIFSTIGGNHDFVLRLPNLLGYVIYLAFAWLLLKRFIRGTMGVLGFVLLNTNPYVLDFFSLCRGYGLSLGFLMASLYFFTLFLSRSGERGSEVDRYSSLTRALGMAAVAVLCNFTLLNVYFSLLAVAALALVILNGRERLRTDPAGPTRFPGKRAVLGLIVLAAVFNILVLSQDLRLSDSLYEPVTIRIPGLAAADTDRIVVKGMDQKKRDLPSAHKNDEWAIGRGQFMTGLHFKIPAATLDGVRDLEIRIGSRTFRITGRKLRARLNGRENLIFDADTSVSLKRATLPLFKPAINWKGDANHLGQIALRFLLLGAVFALAVLLVHGAGRFFVRLKFLGREAYWRLAVPTLALGGLVAYPSFMLKTNGEPIGGGQQGFIHDTWNSLVNNSFYGQLYSPRQNLWVELIGLLSLCLFAAAVLIHARKKTLADLLPGASFAALILFVSCSTILQKALFDNPFLIGRQALFFIPLAALFIVFSLNSFGESSRAAKGVSLSLLAVLTLLSAYHLSQTANAVSTVDWRDGAEMKEVITDLERLKTDLFSQSSTVRLGVDENFLPALVYYRLQRGLIWLDIASVENRDQNDLYYLERPFDPARMVLLERYPGAGNILVQLKNGD